MKLKEFEFSLRSMKEVQLLGDYEQCKKEKESSNKQEVLILIPTTHKKEK